MLGDGTMLSVRGPHARANAETIAAAYTLTPCTKALDDLGL
jgi:hypothetical protein